MSDTGKPRETKLTPMLRQFQEVKEAHPDKLILFRMGDFYETFFDDAYLTSNAANGSCRHLDTDCIICNGAVNKNPTTSKLTEVHQP
jgi:DNA mismatch repair ATPase MutS